MKRYKKITYILAYILVICLFFMPKSALAANLSMEPMSNDTILSLTGMPQSEINELDADIKAFIVDDLRKSGELFDIAYFSTEEIATLIPRVNQVLSDITFSVSAFKSSNTDKYIQY